MERIGFLEFFGERRKDARALNVCGKFAFLEDFVDCHEVAEDGIPFGHWLLRPSVNVCENLAKQLTRPCLTIP